METQECLRRIDPARLAAFQAELLRKEYSVGTVENYLRAVRAFARWSGGMVDRRLVLTWKAQLTAQYAPATVNAMLAGLNRFFDFAGRPECRVKVLRLQRCSFREAERELDRGEYRALVRTARTLGRERLALVMETICATGIRVGEVPFITVEAACRGRTDVALKGKVRTIFLPDRLCRRLLQYARKQKITSGEIFLTRNGTSLSRRQIWTELKRLCKSAGVESAKVFPHNLRHLFATIFYRACKDIVRLADVLGHSSIETTRIYLVTSGAEHARQLERLGLVS